MPPPCPDVTRKQTEAAAKSDPDNRGHSGRMKRTSKVFAAFFAFRLGAESETVPTSVSANA